MSEFKVSSAAVASASSDIANRVAEFEARVTALNHFVSSLIGSGWSGSAADVFNSGWSEWTSGAVEVYDALSRISGLLSSTAQTYESTESAVTAVSSDSSVTAEFRQKGM